MNTDLKARAPQLIPIWLKLTHERFHADAHHVAVAVALHNDRETVTVPSQVNPYKNEALYDQYVQRYNLQVIHITKCLLSKVIVEHSTTNFNCTSYKSQPKGGTVNAVITIVQCFPYSIHLSDAKFVDSAQL